MSVGRAFADAMTRARSCGPVSRLGVAVSGGGDSMALLSLAATWAVENDAEVLAATIDHGLRPEAKNEAGFVASKCSKIGVQHKIIRWDGENHRGNLQDAARRARYQLLAGWALQNELDAVAVAHSADDQAETFLMRLTRGSGVDGLAHMSSDWRSLNMRWLRPLLGASRDELRAYLQETGQVWVEDPSNEDTRFDRVRMRAAMADLASLGLTRARLVETASRMADAREVLSQTAHHAAVDLTRVEVGAVVIDAIGYAKLPDETRHRILSAALSFVASSDYRPRYAALKDIETAVLQGETRTLHGCLLSLQGNTLRVDRELDAIARVHVPHSSSWDTRWQLARSDAPDGAEIRALGDGLSKCETWREIGVARSTLMTAPAIWLNDKLIAAPFAGWANGWRVVAQPTTADFHETLLSH